MKQIQKNRAFTFSIIFIIIVGIVGYFGGNSLGLFNGSEEKYNPKYSVISDVDSSEFISIDILRETLFDDKTETNILIVGKLESFDTISDDINTDYELKTHATGLYLEDEKGDKSHYFDIYLSNGKIATVSIKTYSIELKKILGEWRFSANIIVDLTYLIVISNVDSTFNSIDILSETLLDSKIETNLLIVGKLGFCRTVPDDPDADYLYNPNYPRCLTSIELKTHATGLYLEYVKTEENFAMQSKNYFDISLSNGKFIHVSIQSCSFEFEDVDGMWMFSANAVVDLIYSV